MENTARRKPGRPPKFSEALARREILVEKQTDLDAIALAERRGVSLSEVYRAWIDKGRASDKKGRK